MYRKFFSLHMLPFLTTPDLNFFQPIAQHLQAFETVLYALSQGDAFIQITGEVGVGKTMTLRYIANRIQDDYAVCYLANGHMSEASLMSNIMHELSESPPPPRYGKNYQLEDVNQYILKHHIEGKRVVVLVDEAQSCSDHCLESLRLLTNIETENTKLMQIVLFGQPELQNKLAQKHMRQLSQRIHYRVHIKNPSLIDVKRYLSTRLIAAGHPHGGIFMDEAIIMLYQQTQGILRLINIIAHKALMSAYLHERHYVNTQDIIAAIQETGYKAQYSMISFYLNKLWSKNI